MINTPLQYNLSHPKPLLFFNTQQQYSYIGAMAHLKPLVGKCYVYLNISHHLVKNITWFVDYWRYSG